jgi:tRNA A-37 threonylcarbamoyl transferase component Bud32
MYHRGRGGWQELFDYGGIRYHARLFPSLDGNGIQDDTLRLLTRASEENDDIMDDYGDECRRLIWPLIEQDYTSRSESEKTDLSPSKATVRIEGRSVDGKLHAFTHKWTLDYSTHPIINKFPGVPTFSVNLVRRVERLDPEVFKVENNGQFYCLKTVHSKGGETGLKREISILQRCHHPNIVPCCGVLVNGKKRIEGIMMEFIPDAVTLDQVIDSASGFNKKQCLLWISQIESALEYLHSNSLVWGDAKPANILKRPNDDLVLVDFAGGATEKWVDWQNMDTSEGDLQGLDRIKQFLWDKLDTFSVE